MIQIGVNLPALLGARLAQRGDESLTIHVVLENRLTPVAAIPDMINCTGTLDSQLAGHAGRVAYAMQYANIKNRPLSDASSAKSRCNGKIPALRCQCGKPPEQRSLTMPMG